MDYHNRNYKILQNKLMIEIINNHIDKNKSIKQVGGKRETETVQVGQTLNIADNAKSALINSIPKPSVDVLLKPIINKMMLVLNPLETKLVGIVDNYAKTALTKTEKAYNKIIKKFFKLLWGLITGAIGAIPVVGNAANVIVKGVKSADRILMIIKIGMVYFFTMVVINKQKDNMLDVNTNIHDLFDKGVEKTITQVGGKRSLSTQPTKPAPTKPVPAPTPAQPTKPAPAPTPAQPTKPAPAPAPTPTQPTKPAPAPTPTQPTKPAPTPTPTQPTKPAPTPTQPTKPAPTQPTEPEDVDIFNLIPVKKILKQMMTTIAEEIGEDIAVDTLQFSESIISETIQRFLSLFSEFLVSTFTDMMKNISPREIETALQKIEDKQKNFGALKENLENIGVPPLFVLPLTARLSILQASKIVYKTGDYVYGTIEETVDYIESTMKEIINMVVRIIMQGICKTSGDCQITYS